MEDDEELSQNLFLRVVRSKWFKEVWSKAEEGLLFVCVPQSGCFVSAADVTLEVAESHVMREKGEGQWETLNGRLVTVDGKTVSTQQHSGWDEHRVCTILFEELFYNSAWQKFRVVCIDGALIGGRTAEQIAKTKVAVLPPLHQRTLKNSKAYLESFPENELVLRKFHQYAQEFLEDFFIQKGFEHQARDKVQALLTRCTEDLLCTNTTFRQFHYENQDRSMEALSQVIANYLFEDLHAKLFAEIGAIRSDEDEDLAELSEASRETVNLSQLGVGKMFCATNLPKAVALLEGLEGRVTPLERLLCLKETIDAINSDLEAFRADKSVSSSPLSSSQERVVTSDELLPLIVFVIIRASQPHLASSLAYAEIFAFFNAQMSELGFCLSTFKAAIALMTESKLLNRKRREVYPESRFIRVQGRKSLGPRRTQQRISAAEALKRSYSVPANMILETSGKK